MSEHPDVIKARAFHAAGGFERAIVIETLADLTPPGKRRAAVVATQLNGQPCERRIRWYVGRRAYRDLALIPANVQLSDDWINAGKEA